MHVRRHPRRKARLWRAGSLSFVVLACALPARAFGAPIVATCSGTTGDAASLIAAIGQADATIGPATVQLGGGCSYTLTAVDNNWYGPNGLPAISNDVTIEGSGATIARAPSAPPFRLFFVGADSADPKTNNYVSPGPGRLTLQDVTLSGGLAKGGDANGGGGGAGLGGAIFNQGTVTIERSTLSGNAAQGGSAINSSAGMGGGGIGSDASGTSGGGFGGGFDASALGAPAGGSTDGGGGGFRLGEIGNPGTSTTAGAGGGPTTGLGGPGGESGAAAGDGSGGGARTGIAGTGGAFGVGGDGDGGGGVGGGGGPRSGGGGFGAGGGFSSGDSYGGFGGFGGGGGGTANPNGVAGAPGFGGGSAVHGAGGSGAGMGGAVFNMQGTLTIDDSTIAGNVARGGTDSVSDSGKGIAGAVFNLSGTFTATGSTFARNTGAFYASQIYDLVYDGAMQRTAQTTLRDTIVAGGIGPFDVAADKTDYIVPAQPAGSTANADVGQFDLVRTMNAQEHGTVTGAPLTSDPQLGALSPNGGPTETMLPGSTSPVIDAGSAFGATTDQRGLPRPVDLPAYPNAADGADIGAVEVQAPSSTGGGGGPGGGGPGGGGPGGGGTSPRASVSRETISPGAFRAAPRGPSASAARRRRRVYGAIVRYTLNESARVRFTVVQVRPGRRGPRGRCVAPTRRNRLAQRCTRLVALRGRFTLSGHPGANRFRFTGRLAARALRPGRYRLVATPIANRRTGRAAGARFRIVK